MSFEHDVASSLRGRLADVFFPALIAGASPALARRIGGRACVDDALFGRASTASTIEALLDTLAAYLRDCDASYRHVASTVGVDRDVCEGVLEITTADGVKSVPVALFAERRRMRQIDVRAYYATHAEPRRARAPLVDADERMPLPQIVTHIVESLRAGAIERVVAGFEENARIVDATGASHPKRGGAMAEFFASAMDGFEIRPAGVADDGRTCSIESTLSRGGLSTEALAVSFERGDSGLLRELRLYYEP
jgi:hypothetical protein